MKFTTTKEFVTVDEDTISLKRPLRGRTSYQADEVADVAVSDGKQYLTAGRTAGVLATGGIALLAPRKHVASVVIGLTSGEVITLKLPRSEAKRASEIAMGFKTLGYSK